MSDDNRTIWRGDARLSFHQNLREMADAIAGSWDARTAKSVALMRADGLDDDTIEAFVERNSAARHDWLVALVASFHGISSINDWQPPGDAATADGTLREPVH